MAEKGALIQVTYTKSSIGYPARQKATVRALGLRRLGQSIIQADTPAVRGMVYTVRHLVTVEPLPEAEAIAATGDDAIERSAS